MVEKLNITLKSCVQVDNLNWISICHEWYNKKMYYIFLNNIFDWQWTDSRNIQYVSYFGSFFQSLERKIFKFCINKLELQGTPS